MVLADMVQVQSVHAELDGLSQPCDVCDGSDETSTAVPTSSGRTYAAASSNCSANSTSAEQGAGNTFVRHCSWAMRSAVIVVASPATGAPVCTRVSLAAVLRNASMILRQFVRVVDARSTTRPPRRPFHAAVSGESAAPTQRRRLTWEASTAAPGRPGRARRDSPLRRPATRGSPRRTQAVGVARRLCPATDRR